MQEITLKVQPGCLLQFQSPTSPDSKKSYLWLLRKLHRSRTTEGWRDESVYNTATSMLRTLSKNELDDWKQKRGPRVSQNRRTRTVSRPISSPSDYFVENTKSIYSYKSANTLSTHEALACIRTYSLWLSLYTFTQARGQAKSIEVKIRWEHFHSTRPRVYSISSPVTVERYGTDWGQSQKAEKRGTLAHHHFDGFADEYVRLLCAHRFHVDCKRKNTQGWERTEHLNSEHGKRNAASVVVGRKPELSLLQNL